MSKTGLEPGADAHGGAQDDAWSSDVSDATLRRMLRWIGIALAAVVAVVGVVAVVTWFQHRSEQRTAPNAVDVGFLQDMIDHHEQALFISRTYLDRNPDGLAAPYAREVIMYQQWEIDRMDEWLTRFGLSRGGPDRRAMQWMGMETTVAKMPGMQTPERIGQLASASGTAADQLWFEIMKEHHRGGVHMAEYASIFGARSDIMKFAEKMTYNQSIEIDEYEKAQARLGLTSD